MAETILTECKQDVDELRLIPGSGGIFDVHLNGDRIYSKSETGEFPEHDDILAELGRR